MAKVELLVRYDDGETDKAYPGQREYASWEGEPFGCATTQAQDKAPVVFVRYIAWAYLKRTTGLNVPFQKWSNTVDEIEDLARDEEVDPTKRAQPVGR
jgi:hypothetical protein